MNIRKMKTSPEFQVRILKRNWAQIALGRIWTWWKRIWFYEDQKTERKMILGALDSNYLARTRQVHELIVKNCWYKIFPKDPSPHCQLFVDLSREWVSLDKVQMVHLPASERKALIQFYQNLYMKGEKVLLRQDYKKLVEISLKLLGSQLPAGKQISTSPRKLKLSSMLESTFRTF